MASTAHEAGGGGLAGAERERVIRKIKRCLALGQSSNANEAEMALRQAQAMMRAHRLTEADIQADSVGSERRATGLCRMADWQRMLATTAAAAFGCRVFIARRAGGPQAFEFVGVMPAAELAAYAYDSLLAQLTAARKAFKASHGGARRHADDFCVGWVHAVHKKVCEFAAASTGAGQENALLVIAQKEDAAIDAWVASKHGKVQERKARERDVDALAAALGVKAGATACINQGVGSDRSGQQLQLSN